jgi:hypothetical protein
MALGDDRTAAEIRQSGDETSILHRYNEPILNTSQPGLTPAQRGEDGYAEPDLSMYQDEDDPRWYETDEEDVNVEPEQPEPILNTREIAQQAVADWARGQLDPNVQAAQQVVSAVDERIQAQLNAVREAEAWAEQGRMEREQRAGIRQEQEDMNIEAEGAAQLAQIAQAAATYHGLPSVDPDLVHEEAEYLMNQAALNHLNSGGSVEGWDSLQQQIAQACVEQAAINLGRQQISDNVLKRI